MVDWATGSDASPPCLLTCVSSFTSTDLSCCHFLVQVLGGASHSLGVLVSRAFVHNSIWAGTWLRKELPVMNGVCSRRTPRSSSLLSVRMTTQRVLFKHQRLTCSHQHFSGVYFYRGDLFDYLKQVVGVYQMDTNDLFLAVVSSWHENMRVVCLLSTAGCIVARGGKRKTFTRMHFKIHAH